MLYYYAKNSETKNTYSLFIAVPTKINSKDNKYKKENRISGIIHLCKNHSHKLLL